MWKNIKRTLGRFVQGLKQIFRRRENYQPAQNNGENSQLSEEDKKILKEEIKKTLDVLLEKQDLITDYWKTTLDSTSLDLLNELEFSLNTHRTNLPKPIKFPCKLIVFSTHFNQDATYDGIDMSRYEDKGIAHVFCCVPYNMREYYSDEQIKELAITEEELDRQSFTATYPGGTILYYEETEDWDFILP